MNRHEREAIIDRVEREGATVGAQIPDRLDIGGDVVHVRDHVLAFHRDDDPDEEAVHSLTVALRGERRNRRDRLEDDPDLDRDEADDIADEIIGIDRALATLQTVGSDNDIEAEMRQQQVADTQRWQHFLNKARSDRLDRSFSR